MQANPGDWLVVKSARDSRPARRASIIAVSSGGVPPFTIRWLDTGHEAMVVPGPDAEVVTAAQQAELDREQARRSDEAQRASRRTASTG
jgi:hypothetical protein